MSILRTLQDVERWIRSEAVKHDGCLQCVSDALEILRVSRMPGVALRTLKFDTECDHRKQQANHEESCICKECERKG